MPVRQAAPGQAEDQLVDALLAMHPVVREQWIGRLDDDGRAVVERAMAARSSVGWRSNPLTMAVHLTRDDGPQAVQPWRHSVLLADAFAKGVRAYRSRMMTPWARQQWKVPQQHGKTTGARWGLLWALDQDPTMRWLYVGYAAEKVDEEASVILDLARRFEGELRFTLRPDRQQKGAWKTAQGGGVYAVGITGGIAGWPADGIVMDDLIKGAEAASSGPVRRKARRVYQGEIRQRLQATWCPVYDLGTRVHAEDVTGWLDQEEGRGGEAWHRIILPAFCTDPATDPLGRQLGEVVCPERFDHAEMEARRRTAGSFLWSAIGQQNPTPEEGEELLRSWFRIERHVPPAFDRLIASWDMKATDRQVGDDAVGQVWGRIGGSFWCVDQLAGKWGTPHVRAAIALLSVRWHVSAHYVENTGKAPDMLPALRAGDRDYVLGDRIADDLGMTADERAQVQAMLRRGLSGIVAVNPKGDKKARTRAHLGKLEAGDVHLLDRPWAAELMDQAVQLGMHGVHDDMLDAMTQALSRLGGGAASVPKRTTTTLPAPAAPGQGGGGGTTPVRRSSAVAKPRGRSLRG